MLTQITLAIEICEVVEMLPAYVFNSDFEHATYDYEGNIGFCSIVPTDIHGVYAVNDYGIGLGERTHGDSSIRGFYAKIATMTAYEFLSTFVFDDSFMDFNFITLDTPEE